MSSLKSISPANRFLLWTLVRTAMADGEVVPAEMALINHVMKTLELDQPDRELVRAVLLGRREIPRATTEVAMPKYDNRLVIFRNALYIAFADGDVGQQEHQILNNLVSALQITPADRDRLWRSAKRKYADDV